MWSTGIDDHICISYLLLLYSFFAVESSSSHPRVSCCTGFPTWDSTWTSISCFSCTMLIGRRDLHCPVSQWPLWHSIALSWPVIITCPRDPVSINHPDRWPHTDEPKCEFHSDHPSVSLLQSTWAGVSGNWNPVPGCSLQIGTSFSLLAKIFGSQSIITTTWWVGERGWCPNIWPPLWYHFRMGGVTYTTWCGDCLSTFGDGRCCIWGCHSGYFLIGGLNTQS